MSEFLKAIDMGTKKADSLNTFLKHGAMYYGEDVGRIKPKECMGIDRQEKYRKDVERCGFQFLTMDVLKDFNYPIAEYYLAWDFLEHLPSIEDSNNVLRAMLDHAVKGVWLKMPSFEQDEEGEGQLRRHGLRFTWTHWHGHPSFYKIEDAMAVIRRFTPSARIRHEHQRVIRDSSSKFIVPVGAPLDTTEYTPDLGPKPEVVFRPAVIGCHELIVSLE